MIIDSIEKMAEKLSGEIFVMMMEASLEIARGIEAEGLPFKIKIGVSIEDEAHVGVDVSFVKEKYKDVREINISQTSLFPPIKKIEGDAIWIDDKKEEKNE